MNRYQGVTDFSHSQVDRIGVLLTNLGTPDAPTPAALKRYLKEFLWDPRVVEMPRPLWWLILHGIILNVRPRRSAEAYRSVWTEQGSPLLIHTRNQCAGLRERLANVFGDRVVVDFAMRYGSPSIAEVIGRLQEQGVRKLLVLPLYPQYCAATTASTFDALAADFTKRRWLPELRFVTHYHDFSPYIEALALQIERHWATHGRAERILLSYHGIPKRYLYAGDPYFCECQATSRLLRERLGLSDEECLTTFQSRFGREEWLQPYTDATLKQLPASGVRSVQVVCPGFASDCLETIEEIGVENRDYFLSAGGDRYEYIPALNASSEHLELLEALVQSHLAGWVDEAGSDSEQRSQRARDLGAVS